MSYLNLPAGNMRLLNTSDLTALQYDNVAQFDQIKDGTNDFGNVPLGIGLITQNLRLEGNILQFKPPRDRTWLLAKMDLLLTVAIPGNAINWNFAYLAIDSQTIQSSSSTYTGNNVSVLIFGDYPAQTATFAGFPYNIDPSRFLPVRNNISVYINANNLGGGAQGIGTLTVWVWESYTTLPLSPSQTIPKQPTPEVNTFWR